MLCVMIRGGAGGICVVCFVGDGGLVGLEHLSLDISGDSVALTRWRSSGRVIFRMKLGCCGNMSRVCREDAALELPRIA